MCGEGRGFWTRLALGPGVGRARGTAAARRAVDASDGSARTACFARHVAPAAGRRRPGTVGWEGVPRSGVGLGDSRRGSIDALFAALKAAEGSEAREVVKLPPRRTVGEEAGGD